MKDTISGTVGQITGNDSCCSLMICKYIQKKKHSRAQVKTIDSVLKKRFNCGF